MRPEIPYPFFDDESRQTFDELVVALRTRSGIGVTGAGCSKPLFPDWHGLYPRIRTELELLKLSLLTLPELKDAATDLMTLFELAKKVAGDRGLLDIVKRIFSLSDPDFPEVLDILGSCSVLATLHTFNYDDYLANLGRSKGREIARYPELDLSPVDYPQPFLYLHGQVSQSKLCDDIVLTKSSYDRAYGASSLLRDLMRTYFFRAPVLFVGTSLSDAAFTAVLRGLASLRTSRGEDGSEIIGPRPHWYGFFGARGRTRRDKERFVLAQGEALRSDNVQPIWYDLEGEDHSALLQCLYKLTEDTALSVTGSSPPDLTLRMNAATRLARQSAPGPSHFAMAASLLGEPAVLSAFLQECRSPSWLDWLTDRGFLQPTEPTLLPDGGAKAEAWPAALYLERMAKATPESVGEILRQLSTSNWIAIGEAARILALLPPPISLTVIPTAEKWMEDRSVPTSALIRGLLNCLEACNASTENLDDYLYGRLVRLIVRFFGTEAGRYGERYIWGERATGLLQTVGLSSALCAWDALADELVSLATREWNTPKEDASWIHRPVLEAADTPARGEPLDWLVDTALAVLRRARRARGYSGRIRHAYSNQWPVLQRFALYEASQSKKALRAIRPLLVRDLDTLMESNALYHELALLLREESGNVHSELIERFQIVLQEEGDDESRLSRRWIGALASEPGSPEDFDPTRLFQRMRFFRPVAPMDQASFDALASGLDEAQLLSTVRNPAQHGIRLDITHDANGLWDLLAANVLSTGRFRIAESFVPEDFERGAWRVLESAVGWASNNPDDWPELARLLNTLVDSSPRSTWASLHALAKALDAGLPESEFADLVSMAADYVGAYSTDPADGWPLGHVRNSEGRTDVLTHQLNDEPGMAAELLFSVATREYAKSKELSLWFRELVFKCQAGWGGLEFMVVVGSAFPLIVAGDRPLSIAVSDYALTGRRDASAEAFWSGYAWRASTYDPALELLSVRLADVVLANDKASFLESQVQSKLIGHMNIGVLRRLRGFELTWSYLASEGSGDLLEDVASSACRLLPDDVVEYGQMYDTVVSFLNEDIARAMESDKPGKWGRLSLWLPKVTKGVGFPRVQPVVRSIAGRTDGWDLHQLVDYLNSQASDYPSEIAEIVVANATRWAGMAEAQWSSDSLRELLTTLAAATGRSDILRTAINEFVAARLLTLPQANELLRIRR